MPSPVALVTGASTGLGEQFARLLARDGHDLVLVARTASRLQRLGEELERLHKVKVKVLPADLRDPLAPRHLFDAVTSAGLEVEILVNNAGFGTTGPFLDLDRDAEVGMVQVNCTALLELTHLFGRGMRERKKGRILNIASTAGFQAGPFMATYYASKAFVLSFTEALADELKGTGVTATAYCPGATHTEFARRSGNEQNKLFQRPGVATAEDVALDAYEAMRQGDVVAVHGLMNWLAAQGVRLVPRSVARSITAALNKP